MKTKAFDRLACEALCLPYPPDVEGSEDRANYHQLGTFKPAEAPACIDAAYKAIRPKYCYSYRSYLHACGHADSMRRELETKTYDPDDPPDFTPYIYKYRFLDSYSLDRYTKDRAGYLNYLRDREPEVYRLLQRDIPVYLKERDRRLHTYVVGTTEAGKTETVKVLMHSYVTYPGTAAIVAIDPAGDFVREVAQWKEQITSNRLVYIDPYLMRGYTPTINPFQLSDNSEWSKDIAAQQILGVFKELIKGSSAGELTLNMEALLVPCLLTLLDREGSTLADLKRFMIDGHNGDLVELGKQSSRYHIREFFRHDFAQSRFGPTKGAISTKIQSLLNFEAFANFMCGPSTIDLEDAINQRKIILFNLSKGRVGPEVSEALGRFIIATLQGIAMRRERLPKRKRVRTHLFIDECQNFVSKSMLTILGETRKFAMLATLIQPGTGFGMSPTVRDDVLRLTNIKIVGKTTDIQECRHLAALLRVDEEDVVGVRRREFLVQAGDSPTFKLHVASHLADTRNRMTTPTWRSVVRQQVRRYYRDVSQRSDVEHNDNTTPTQAPPAREGFAPRRKRRFV